MGPAKQDKKIDYSERHLPLAYLTELDGKRIVAATIDAYFHSKEVGTDTLSERLRNAILLLHHADQLLAEPLALSVCFAAIEALACEKELPVNMQIKKHVSTLLVQDAGNGQSIDVNSPDFAQALETKRKTKEKVLSKL
jgi:hypothetical protein